MFKTFIKILVLSLFFSVVIFFINYNFFLEKENNIKNNIAQELYIEPSITKNSEILNKKEKEIIKDYYKQILYYKINFIPNSFILKANFLKNNINNFLENKIFKTKIKNLIIDLYENKEDRRWNMYQKHIRLYWIKKEKENEYLAVFIHELWHYIDLYFFEKKVFFDISDKFYEISWKNTKTKLKWQNTKDFVSGYAMTNKYEDFAESFTFYILHNKEFLIKSENSKILKRKYDFFSNYLFKNKEFFISDFSKKEYKTYYWDTTKIPFSKEKLLKYLKK